MQDKDKTGREDKPGASGRTGGLGYSGLKRPGRRAKSFDIMEPSGPLELNEARAWADLESRGLGTGQESSVLVCKGRLGRWTGQAVDAMCLRKSGLVESRQSWSRALDVGKASR